MYLIQESFPNKPTQLAVSFRKESRDLPKAVEAHLQSTLIPSEWQSHFQDLVRREQALVSERTAFLAQCKENFAVTSSATDLGSLLSDLEVSHPELFL